MMDLRELYQDIILDHGRHPRNFRTIEHPTHTAQGYNPLCGDRVTVYLTLDGDRITRCRVPGTRLRNFDGRRLADDRSAQGKVCRRSARIVRAFPCSSDRSSRRAHCRSPWPRRWNGSNR